MKMSPRKKLVNKSLARQWLNIEKESNIKLPKIKKPSCEGFCVVPGAGIEPARG